MPLRLGIPANVSYVERMEDGRLYAAAAERNAEAISQVIARYAPQHGIALEIASGTGQHVARFARVRPNMIWQPTDADRERLPSIDSWVSASGVMNVLNADFLDAANPGWHAKFGGNSLVLIVNLLHMISASEAETLISEAALSLVEGGRIIIYGPFLRDNRATSTGDWTFDATLRSSDPEIGYKDDGQVINWLRDKGLKTEHHVDMPANNLCFVATRTPKG